MTTIEEPEQKTWNGNYNWHGEIFNMHCTSSSATQAYRFFCKRIAEKLGHLTSNEVRHYFYDTDRYSIKEVKKK